MREKRHLPDIVLFDRITNRTVIARNMQWDSGDMSGRGTSRKHLFPRHCPATIAGSEPQYLRDTARHQSPCVVAAHRVRGNLLDPRIWDILRGESWIDNKLSSFRTLAAGLSSQPRSRRHAACMVFVQIGRGQTELRDIWLSENKLSWCHSAFIVCVPPKKPYRVRLRFFIQSGNERRRDFNLFCSPLSKAFDTSHG